MGVVIPQPRDDIAPTEVDDLTVIVGKSDSACLAHKFNVGNDPIRNDDVDQVSGETTLTGNAGISQCQLNSSSLARGAPIKLAISHLF